MPRNVEVKVAVSDLAVLRAAALAAGARRSGVERQTDRYYELDGGRRVKLRTRAGGAAELIRYDRPETAGVRASDYEVTPVRDPAAGACLVPARRADRGRAQAPRGAAARERPHPPGRGRAAWGRSSSWRRWSTPRTTTPPAAARSRRCSTRSALSGAEPIRASYGELVRHAG